jgi:hypothetical protein
MEVGCAREMVNIEKFFRLYHSAQVTVCGRIILKLMLNKKAMRL